MGSPFYRATTGGLNFDAFYKDEFGVINDASNCSVNAADRSGFHKNTFTSVITRNGVISETAQGFAHNFANKALPAVFTNLPDKSNPVPAAFNSAVFPLKIYFSDSVQNYWQSLKGKGWTDPLNLTLYFGVGHELTRHGIRSFFKNQPNMQAIAQVPGMEKPQFGVTPDDTVIKDALKGFFQMDVPYRIKVLAAFSTGSCGLNQALLNDLIAVDKVERLIFYDCLYSQQCGNTANAIRKLKQKASDKLKIVVYKTSECANSFKEKAGDCPDPLKTKCPAFPNGKCLDFNRLAVIVDNQGLIPASGVISNLFQNPDYIALVIFRALEAAVADSVISLSNANRQVFNDMQTLLAASPRGLMISNKTCFQFVHGNVPNSPPYTYFEDWSKTNSKIIRAFYAKVGLVSTKDSFRNLLWNNALPGWPGGDGEDKHDLLIPEFGWEYLPY